MKTFFKKRIRVVSTAERFARILHKNLVTQGISPRMTEFEIGLYEEYWITWTGRDGFKNEVRVLGGNSLGAWKKYKEYSEPKCYAFSVRPEYVEEIIEEMAGK